MVTFPPPHIPQFAGNTRGPELTGDTADSKAEHLIADVLRADATAVEVQVVRVGVITRSIGSR